MRSLTLLVSATVLKSWVGITGLSCPQGIIDKATSSISGELVRAKLNPPVSHVDRLHCERVSHPSLSSTSAGTRSDALASSSVKMQSWSQSMTEAGDACEPCETCMKFTICSLPNIAIEHHFLIGPLPASGDRPCAEQKWDFQGFLAGILAASTGSAANPRRSNCGDSEQGSLCRQGSLSKIWTQAWSCPMEARHPGLGQQKSC